MDSCAFLQVSHFFQNTLYLFWFSSPRSISKSGSYIKMASCNPCQLLNGYWLMNYNHHCVCVSVHWGYMYKQETRYNFFIQAMTETLLNSKFSVHVTKGEWLCCCWHPDDNFLMSEDPASLVYNSVKAFSKVTCAEIFQITANVWFQTSWHISYCFQQSIGAKSWTTVLLFDCFAQRIHESICYLQQTDLKVIRSNNRIECYSEPSQPCFSHFIQNNRFQWTKLALQRTLYLWV